MDQKANPMPKQGERNIYCPYYNDCLDYAVRASWQTWDCSQCLHKLIKESITEYELNNTEPYYDLPPNVIGAIWKDAFD
jgi:hypothetical protein